MFHSYCPGFSCTEQDEYRKGFNFILSEAEVSPGGFPGLGLFFFFLLLVTKVGLGRSSGWCLTEDPSAPCQVSALQKALESSRGAPQEGAGLSSPHRRDRPFPVLSSAL